MIRSAVEILAKPGSVLELRIPHVAHEGTVNGYFTDIARMAQRAVQMSGRAEGVYVTLNPINPDLLARASNRLVSFARHTTRDDDVVCLYWLLVDFDPVRPAGISSTDAEHQKALARARQCREWLRTQGWPDPLLASSGNGAHLLYRIDLLNNSANSELLKSCLGALGFWFSDSDVEVDLSTWNSGRLVKLYGTLAAKGDSLPERPHRLACMLEVPSLRQPVAVDLLTELAGSIPKDESQAQAELTGSKPGKFNSDRWIADRKLVVEGPTDWKGGRRWILEVCPWNPDHRKSAFILQFPSGAVAAGCLHRSCAGKDWHALRDTVEPSWRIHSAQHRNEAWVEWKVDFHTAAEVAAQTPERPEWIARPWIAKGTITEVEGKIKSAGKTTFVTHLVSAVLDGVPFMGQPTTKTSVVYLTEQPRPSFRAALARANLLEREDLSVLFWHDVMPVPWPVVARAALEECRRLGSKLLVVDTGAQFVKLIGDTENNAGDVLHAMQSLQEAAAAGIGVIVVWHERKSGGEVGDAGRGSSAVGGVVDVVVAIRRPGGNSQPTIRQIHARSRFDETPEELMVELTERGYVALGQSRQVETRKAEAAILAAAPQTEGDAITLNALLDAAETKRSSGQRVVGALLDNGKLARIGNGKKSDPYKYWKPNLDSSQAPPPGERDIAEVVSEPL